jgi:hypothetical protein
MMTNDRLLAEVAEGAERAWRIAWAAARVKHMRTKAARALSQACYRATAAAQELENRSGAVLGSGERMKNAEWRVKTGGI